MFGSENIQHVNNKINPVEDLETIKTEIILSDIESHSKKLEKSKKKILSQNQIEILETALKQLDKGDELEKLEVEKKEF